MRTRFPWWVTALVIFATACNPAQQSILNRYQFDTGGPPLTAAEGAATWCAHTPAERLDYLGIETLTALRDAGPAPDCPEPEPPAPPADPVGHAIAVHLAGHHASFEGWHCIARHESGLDPGVVSASGTYHGLFQLSATYGPHYAGVAGVAWSAWADPNVNAAIARAFADDAARLWGDPLRPWPQTSRICGLR